VFARRFSIRVALAGKIAGKARNKPPTTGPKRKAISPAMTVIAPPSANLIEDKSLGIIGWKGAKTAMKVIQGGAKVFAKSERAW
jgi:hypothetical protein